MKQSEILVVFYLPSQRTLRDYSHCVRASAGYSSDVDLQLIRAANILSCPEWHKFVILLIDEMYIREDLVYNKHSGRLIGFTDLGSINNHLSAFERSINEGEVIAKPFSKIYASNYGEGTIYFLKISLCSISMCQHIW